MFEPKNLLEAIQKNPEPSKPVKAPITSCIKAVIYLLRGVLFANQNCPVIEYPDWYCSPNIVVIPSPPKRKMHQ